MPASISESVAEHSFHTALIAGFIASKLRGMGVKVDVYKAIAIALLHDTPECIIGDIPLYIQRECKAVSECKKELEAKAIESILGDCRELVELYLEWSKCSSIEAIIAKVSDKLSTLLQACEYYKMGYSRVKEIADSCIKSIRRYVEGVSELKSIVEEILTLYTAILKNSSKQYSHNDRLTT